MLVLIIAIAAVGWFGYRAVVAAVVAPQEPGPSIFSPYVDATAWPPFAFESPPGAAQSDVTLAFVVADPDDECAPSWGGYYSLDEASSAIELDRRVRQLRNVGGDVRVSFGGAINSELATVCESEGRLVDAYRDVVERYELTTIDLDIEGSALSDTAANGRRATAIATLQQEVTAAGGELNVWITVPVGTNGLTPEGERLYADMLEAGVEVAGVNGMAMNLGVPTTASSPQSEAIMESLTAVHGQVVAQLRRAGFGVSDTDAWGLIGVTVMIGQNDTATERFTINDAEEINTFAREHGVGLVSMWSLNRDAPCVAPVPTESTVVQDNCSGVDQQGQKFSDVLAKDLVKPLPQGKPTPVATPSESPSPVPTLAPGDIVDDPATSPYPIWDPLGTYPGGTKIVWRHNVYEARYWNTGFAPDTPVGNPYDSPWTLLGPVLPGDKPAPLPTLPEGTYPAWDAEKAYVAGDRVQLGTVPYEAKWWSQGTEPGTNVPGGSPWVLIFPAQ
jgi:chitinase